MFAVGRNRRRVSLSQKSGQETGQETGVVEVWDFPTRAFHWAVVLLLVLAWLTSEGEGGGLFLSFHVQFGIAILALLVFRLIWGVIGSKHARFEDFVRPWGVVRRYGARLLAFNPPRYLGHNPLGGWMVVLLLAVLFLSVISGLAVSHGGYVGPFARGVLAPLGFAHEGITTAVLTLAGIHVFGVAVHFFLFGENLPRAMVTGVKPQISKVPDVAGGFVAPWRAALALGGAMVVTWWWVG